MKEIIITSSVLILCIMLIRIIFKGKISGRLQYALWLLVALRLIIPSSAQIHMAIGFIDEFRIMDLVEAWEERFGDVTEQLEKPVQFTMSVNNPLAGQVAEFMLGEDLDTSDGPTSVFVAGRIGLIWLDILRGIWIGGMVIVALWMIITNIVFSRRLHKSRKEFVLPEELESICGRQTSDKMGHRRAGKAEKIKFYTTDYLTSSCLYGIPGREAVYLTPDIVQDQSKLRHVVTHEMCHRRHGDSFWSILRSILIAVYWMNPLVWVAAVLSKRDCELACDEEALLLLGEDERIPYGETLLSIITGKSKLSDIACTATTMNGSGKSVKERIKFIAEKPKVLGAAVVAVLILIIIISVFVFTKQPLYSGQTWEGEMVLTAGDMQVRLPETIAGISSYDTERDGNDIIIYQVSTGKEAGRFSVLSCEAALGMVDEGREIIPIGNYGMNNYLKSYMNPHIYKPAETTTHIYTPTEINPEEIESGIAEEDDDNPMLDSEWEVVPLEEEEIPLEEGIDYLPNEQITTTDILPDSDSVTTHSYTPAEGQTQGALSHEDIFYPEDIGGVSGVPGTDINEETTYMIDDTGSMAGEPEETEGSVDYLPNEQITTEVVGAESVEFSTDKCFVYVKGDYSDVQEKYLDEMEYIGSELEIVAGHVIVISINQKIRDGMFDTLAENRTEYLGDASKTGALVNALPQADGLVYRGITLHTLETEPETALSLDVRYEMSVRDMSEVDEDILFFNAAMLFATIKNMDECSFILEESSQYKGEYLDGSDASQPVESYATLTYNREDLEKAIGTLWSDEAAESDEGYVPWLEDLYMRVMDYL